MPNNGLLFSAETLEYEVRSVASGSHSGDGTGINSHSARGYTAWIRDTVNIIVGMDITISGTSESGGSWSATYNGPGAPFGGYTVTGTGSWEDVRMSARLTNFKLYARLTGCLLQTSYDHIEIWVNGSLSATLVHSGRVSDGVGPCYIPYIGIPMTITGGAGASTDTGTLGDEYDYSTETSCTVSGGWRWRETALGAWLDCPVTLAPVDAPEPGSCSFLPLSAVVATRTYGDILNCRSLESARRAFLEEQSVPTTTVIAVCACPGHPGTSYEENLGHFTGDFFQEDGSFGPNRRKVYEEETISESVAGTITLVPDLAKTIKRMGADYRALWYRDSMPHVYGSGSGSCTYNGVSSTDVAVKELFPDQSAILSTVGNTAHAIEDTLGYRSYSPFESSTSRSRVLTHPIILITPAESCPPSAAFAAVAAFTAECATHGGLCAVSISCLDDPWPSIPDDVDDESSQYAIFPSAAASSWPNYLYHDSPLVKYLHSWCNPHWHYYHWFPPNTIDTNDDEIPDEQEQWLLDGVNSPNQYWMAVREQWLYQSALPTLEKRRTRNSIIGSCVNDSGHTLFMDAFFGNGLRWLGISRFKVDAVTVAPNKTLTSASAAAWTFTGCTCVFGADMVLSQSGGATSYTVKYDLGRWTEAPYQYAHLCNQIALNWEAANIASITWKLVGIDGSEVTLGTTTGTKTRPLGGATKYAGSWGIDNGAGTVSDQGTDHDAGGISFATMSDPERTLAFQLLPGRTAQYLKAEITPTVPATAVTLHYPQFIAPTTHPAVVWESAQCAALLWPSGPGIRWGNFYWYDPLFGFQDPPLIKGLGGVNTIIDWLCFRREVLQGLHALDGLTTELGTLYDAFEGQSVSVVDKFSVAFFLPKGDDETIRGALVNTMAEVPAIGWFPYRKRSLSNWAADGVPAQEVWDYAFESRPIISAVQPVDLFHPDGTTQESTPVIDPATNWKQTKFAPALANDEMGWKIKRGTTEFASARPWHGWFFAGTYSTSSSNTGPTNHHTPDGRFYRAHIDAGNVWVSHSWYSVPLPWASQIQVTITGDCSFPRIAEDTRQRAELRYIRLTAGAYSMVRRYSDDDGKSFSGETVAIANAKYADLATSPNGDIVYAGFVPNSGTSGPGKIKLQYQGAGVHYSSLPAAVAIKDTTGADMVFDDTSFGISFAFEGAARLILSAVISGETSTSEWSSADDGATWTRLA